MKVCSRASKSKSFVAKADLGREIYFLAAADGTDARDTL
jgi:hypothetical protein